MRESRTLRPGRRSSGAPLHDQSGDAGSHCVEQRAATAPCIRGGAGILEPAPPVLQCAERAHLHLTGGPALANDC